MYAKRGKQRAQKTYESRAFIACGKFHLCRFRTVAAQCFGGAPIFFFQSVDAHIKVLPGSFQVF